LTTRRALRVHALIDSLTWGGAELLLADLAEGAEGHELELSVGYLFSEREAEARLRDAGLNPRWVGTSRLADPRALALVGRHLADARPDILHTHLQYSDLLGGVAARMLGIPAVTSLHVMDPRATFRERARARLAAVARRRCHRLVIAVSEYIRGLYLATGADRPEHVVTVHNGISARAAPGVGGGLRVELGLEPEELVVAVVGVLRQGKGHDLAVAAVEELRREMPKVRLLIAGEGPARRDIERLAGRLGGAAVLIGHRDDVMAVLDAADVLLHATRADVFPTVVLQALAAGVPIVASRVGGIPEIVQDGRTGLLVPPPLTASAFANPLGKLLRDADLRRSLAERGRERFEDEFTADRWVARLRAVYEQARA
jgi:glycosyltransferase involved in cell wall biosynthesis